jgi:O-antigen/teichoic acid export membrane protein/SAM-dependent methyltransferase
VRTVVDRAEGLREGRQEALPVRRRAVLGFLRSYCTPAGLRALSNLLGLIGCQAVSQGCLFGLLLVYTAGLGPQRYAAVATVGAVQALLLVVGTAGLPLVVLRELAARPGARDEIVAGFVTAAGACSLVMGLAAGVAAAVLPLDPAERWLWWLATGANMLACLNPSAVYDAEHRQASAAARQLPGDVLALLAGVVLLRTGTLTLPAVGLVQLGRGAIQFLGLAVGVRLRWRPAWSAAVALVRGGWPVLVAGLLFLIPSAGGVVVLRLRAGAEAAAVFGVASQLAVTLPLLFGLFVRVVQPHVNGPHGLERSFVRKLAASAALVLAGLVTAGAVAGWVVFRFVLAPAYANGFAAYLTLLVANAVCGIGMIASAYLIRFHAGTWLKAVNALAAGVFVWAALVWPATPFATAAAVLLGYVCACGAGLAGLALRRREQVGMGALATGIRAAIRRPAEVLRGYVEGALARVLPGPPLVCNVCGRRVLGFRPLPRVVVENLRRHGWPYALDQAETCNHSRYSCRVCGATDRDRLLALYLEQVFAGGLPGGSIRLLDIAPSAPLARFIRRAASAAGLSLHYRSADLSREGVDDRVDITRMDSYPYGCWDVVICSHVLEHVPDDRAALRELFRVTSPGGRVLLLVPLVCGVDTIDEDPAVTDPGERWRRFGQDDHVRLYSKTGFVERIREAGFVVREVGAADFTSERFARHGIAAQSILYVALKGAAAGD